LIVFAVIAVVLVVAGAAILLSSQRGQATDLDFTDVPFSRGEDGAFILGDPDAPMTLVEFADFACPHCQTYHDSTVKTFINDYVKTGRAKFEFRIFPTAGGQLSAFTGSLAECADNQRAGAFWQAYDLLYQYAVTGRYTQDVGRILASDLGLSYSQLLDCSTSADQWRTDVQFGQSVGVQGTPAVMVRYGDSDAQWVNYNGRVYDRSGVDLDVLAALVDNAQ
jgi:protein-disulfide isomerase